MTRVQPSRQPVTTYRLQFNRDFRFADAEALVPYLTELGVTECYCSPYLKANPGSRHGYDICEHGSLNPELGSEADYDEFCSTLQAHGLGHIIDFVPNHMAAEWLLVGFFRQLPAELEEAAAIDGAGRLRALWEIVLPLAWPGLATTAILTFLYCWNEFLFALSFTLGPERYTVPVAIALFRGQYQVPWGQILAAAVVATLPVVVIVLVAQRRIVAGLTAGAVKG